MSRNSYHQTASARGFTEQLLRKHSVLGGKNRVAEAAAGAHETAAETVETAAPASAGAGVEAAAPYGAYEFIPVEDSSELREPLWRDFLADIRLRIGPETHNVACIVVHGMGQQVPFETAAGIAEAFVAGKPDARAQANRVRLREGSDLLTRLEVTFGPKTGPSATNLHIYEGYWAPLTEGKISFYESVSFLLGGAWSGIVTCLRNRWNKRAGFSRWLFGDMVDLPIKPRTLPMLLLAVVVLGLALGIAYLGQRLWKQGMPHFASAASWWIPAGWLLLVGVAAIYVYWLHYALIEFVGDVAIYVSAHKVSKFEEVRGAIQKAVMSVAQQVYEAQASRPGGKLYDRVIVLGHSLGSVVAYDLLNQLIVWDRMAEGGAHQVIERTSHLITYGSPLDKTAFLFRTQISPMHHFREAMAGVQQPLILSYELRPETFQWVNLYSPRDIISGCLAYYDLPDPDPAENRVVNIAAPGMTPILAHVQYTGTRLFQRMLDKALRGEKIPSGFDSVELVETETSVSA